MSTRSSARNHFPPLDYLDLTIRRRSRADPTLLNNFEMAAEGPGDLPVLDLWTMDELCQPSLNGRGGPISLIAIQATNFGLKNDMIQQVQNSCQFHGLPGDDANKHLDKFLHVTQSIKVNGVIDDALCLYLFPHSLTHRATAWFDRLPRNSINTFEQMAKMFLGKYFPPSMDTSAQRSKSSSSITSSSNTKIAALKAEMAEINKNLMRVLQPPLATLRMYMLWEPIKANDAILKNMQTNMTSLTNSNLELKNMFGQFMKINTASSSGLGTLPGNTITNPKEELKGITTRSETAYQGPTIPTTFSSLPPVVECETEETKDTVHPTNNRSTKDVQPSVVQTESLILNSEPVVAPIIEPIVAPVSAPKPNQRPSIPYPSRFQDQKLHDKANDQREKFFQIFKDLNFNISFTDALIPMPKFGPSIKSLLTNKDKLYELAKTLLNEHYSAVLLKKFPEKLGDPDKFLIPCDFPGMAECLALADLDASINLMPLSVWNKLSLPKLTPTLMNLKLADRSISRPIGVTEYVYVKVGKFHFLTDFVVVDFDADLRVPLILGRSFLKTGRALIDVFEGELTLRVVKEAITFNLDQTLRYSANYNDMTENQINVIDMAWRDSYSQAFLNDDSSLPPPNQGNYLPQVRKELKICEAKTDKSSIDEPPEGIDPEFCTHKILMEEDFELAVQHQRRVNPKILDVIKNEVLKLLDAGLIYLISDSPWRCEDTNLCLNWEKSHFMVKEGIVLGHKISKNKIKVDKAKVDVIAKLPHPTTVKDTQKTEAPILIAPDWDFPFELMCDASDFAIGAVLG
uniref:Reverse transcriptase domain-containing protein n=1 Tax=Tanacetum cinerariifolium TaxID=118510 RepID=A0A6L2LUX9_TANCI|nr:reverse transcriptase domain-containing protein [Tanacetum cinerariifolium]